MTNGGKVNDAWLKDDSPSATRGRPPRVGSFVLRPLSLILCGLGLLTAWSGAADSTGETPIPTTPFLRLRETTLGYHGSEGDLTNLTEISIGWFGPTNLDDPFTGDLWWAVSLAIREANASAGTSLVMVEPAAI